MSWADNDATISKLFLWIATHAPVTSMVFSFWAGILTGHLFLPQIPLSTKIDFHSRSCPARALFKDVFSSS